MTSIRERIMWKAARNRVPITGAFELTPMCNFQCKMCYIRKSHQEVKELGGLRPLEFWLNVAGQARDAGTLSPLLTGGEPILYPHFRELYTALNKMGMEVSINSNGSSITEELVSWMKEMPPIRINITLYGGSNETYGRLCGDPKGLDKVLRGVELLKKNHIRFRFNCSLTPDNAGDLEKMLAIGEQYGSKLRVATYMFPPLRRIGHEAEFKERLSPEECAYYQVLTDWKQMTPETFRRTAAHAARFQELTPEMIEEAGKGSGQPLGCLSGRCSFWVDWQGNLSGCGMMDYPKVSLADNSFAEAWGQIVDWTNHASYGAYCANCVNHSVCYICAAMVYNETGGLTERPVYLCEKAKYAAYWYQKFAEQLPEPAADDPAKEDQQIKMGTCVFEE